MIYSPVLNAHPTYDDVQYFLDPELRKWDWRWWKSWYNRSLSTATIRAVFCFIPPAYQLQVLHLSGAILHWINACLVFSLASLLGGNAEIAALLFVVAPLAVPAVTPVAFRSTLLSTAFMLLSVIAVVSGHPVLAVFLLGPAVHSREDAIVFLPVILWLMPGWWIVRIMGLFFLLGLVFAKHLKYVIQHKMEANGDVGMRAAGFDESLKQPTYTVTAITENVLRWPGWLLGLGQNADPAIQPARWSGRLRLALLVLGSTVPLLVIYGNTSQIGRIVLLLLVFSPWVASWFFPLPDVVSEGRAYSTLVAISLLISTWDWLILTATLTVAGLATVATYRAYQRRSPGALWQSCWRPDWPKLRVAVNIGADFQQTGDMAQAQLWHETALKIAPENPIVLANIGLWHEGMARIARRDFAQDLVQSGQATQEKAQLAQQQSTAHMQQAVLFMRWALEFGPEEPMVCCYSAKVFEHAQLVGVTIPESKRPN